MNYSVDKKGLLQGDKVQHALVNKHSGPFGAKLPDMIVMHYTGGSTMEGAVAHLKNPQVQASAHLVIGQDGRIVQLVEFGNIAWHAGKSSYQNRSGINQYSIGIEMDNAGPMKRVGDEFMADFGGRYKAAQVVEATHRNETAPRYWHTYSEAQISCVFAVCTALVAHYGIKHVVGHEEIAPGRKTDPGPAFPLDKLRAYLLEARSEDAPDPVIHAPRAGIVTASSLNFRAAPRANSRQLREPLPADTPLQILEERNGWYHVKLEQEGWVKKEHVRVGDA